MITTEPYLSLPQALKNLLNSYTKTEFGNVHFVQQHTWSTPDWTILKYEGTEVVTFYNVIERTVELDGKELKAAGIHNVITPVQHRGKGYSSQALQESKDFIFGELQAEVAILLCADAMVPFYTRLGWYKVDSELFYEQPHGEVSYASNTLLLVPDTSPKLYPKVISLNGLPW